MLIIHELRKTLFPCSDTFDTFFQNACHSIAVSLQYESCIVQSRRESRIPNTVFKLMSIAWWRVSSLELQSLKTVRWTVYYFNWNNTICNLHLMKGFRSKSFRYSPTVFQLKPSAKKARAETACSWFLTLRCLFNFLQISQLSVLTSSLGLIKSLLLGHWLLNRTCRVFSKYCLDFLLKPSENRPLKSETFQQTLESKVASTALAADRTIQYHSAAKRFYVTLKCPHCRPRSFGFSLRSGRQARQSIE